MAACGGISALTLDAAERSPDFSVVAIQDVDPEALRRVGDRYQIARRHTRFEELLTPDVDLVVINSPNHLHLEQVCRAAEAGKHCLVQKPMARTFDEALAMVRAAENAGVRLGVFLFEHSKPVHHQLRSMVASGWLGAPCVVQGLFAHDLYLKRPPPPDDWRRDPQRTGGGAFIQLAVHHMNLAAWILDRDLVEVSAVAARGLTVFEDETTLAAAVFRGGVVASFAASYATRRTSLQVAGTEGMVELTDEHILVRGERPFDGEVFRYDAPGRERVFSLSELMQADGIEAQRDALEVHGRFARWIAADAPFPCTGRRGLRDMQALSAVYRSLQEGRRIPIP